MKRKAPVFPKLTVPIEIKRGPLWIIGRILLLAAALTIVVALIFSSRSLPDHSAPVINYLKQVQSAEHVFFSQQNHFGALSELSFKASGEPALAHYTFTLKPKKSSYSILAIPDDPRQKSFYSDETNIIRSTPGTQAANADSPPIN